MVVTLSEKESQLLRRKMALWIEEMSAIIRDSPEEKLLAFNLDFFEI